MPCFGFFRDGHFNVSTFFECHIIAMLSVN